MSTKNKNVKHLSPLKMETSIIFLFAIRAVRIVSISLILYLQDLYKGGSNIFFFAGTVQGLEV